MFTEAFARNNTGIYYPLQKGYHMLSKKVSTNLKNPKHIPTIKEMFHNWLEEKTRLKNPIKLSYYESFFTWHFSKIEDMQVNALSPHDWAQFICNEVISKKTNPSTLKAMVMGILRYAEEEGFIDFSSTDVDYLLRRSPYITLLYYCPRRESKNRIHTAPEKYLK